MNDEHREAVRAANKRRANCPRCNNTVEVRDGKEIGGVPTVKYKCCSVCGWTRAITHRQRKFTL